MDEKVIFVGAFRFPDGDAASARVLSLGKMLRDGGYEVWFSGWEPEGRPEDRLPDGSYQHQGFPYWSQAELRSTGRAWWSRARRYLLAGTRTLRWLRSTDLTGVSVIVAYHGNSFFLTRLFWLCRTRRIRLVFDCTEWYDPASHVDGRIGLGRLDNEIRMRCVNSLIGVGIVISKQLQTYYTSKGCDVVRVPPLVDLNDEKWSLPISRPCETSALRLVYAGNPGKKDLLGNVIEGLAMLRNEKNDVVLDVLGPTRDEVIQCLGGDAVFLDRMGGMVVVHGRIPQASVPAVLKAADFSVLLRPQKRYAQMGFPTKLVESLAASVPIITNRTGDIADYVRDGVEGVLVEDESPAAFARGLRRALGLSNSDRKAMRHAARVMAEKSLDYRVYGDELVAFCRRTSVGLP